MTIKEIQKIIKEFETSSLMTLELEMDDFKLRLSKNKESNIVAPQQPQKTESKVELNNKVPSTEYKVIKSPLVGTFYAATTPNGEPFVKVGQQVKKGEVVCIIEAMKILNEITSPFTGVVKEVLVQNQAVVGFDHHLIRVGEINEE